MQRSETRIYGRTLGALARLQAGLAAEERQFLAAVPLRTGVEAVDAVPVETDYTGTSPEIEAVDGAVQVEGGPEWAGKYWNLVLLGLVARSLPRDRPYRVPPAQHDALVAELERIVDDCAANASRRDALGDPDFMVDAGFATGRLLHFGPFVGEVQKRLPSWVPRPDGTGDDPEQLWVQFHFGEDPAAMKDDRAMSDGSVAACAFYRENPGYGGLFCFGWLSDPQVAEVSPHLAFVQERLRAGGATTFSLGHSEDETIVHATSTSATRRRLYEEGRWTPTEHGLVWSREAYLRWAEELAVRA